MENIIPSLEWIRAIEFRNHLKSTPLQQQLWNLIRPITCVLVWHSARCFKIQTYVQLCQTNKDYGTPHAHDGTPVSLHVHNHELGILIEIMAFQKAGLTSAPFRYFALQCNIISPCFHTVLLVGVVGQVIRKILHWIFLTVSCPWVSGNLQLLFYP